MTHGNPATLAVAADYADALMTARRAKNWLFLLLLLILVLQLALFLLVRFNVLKLSDRAGLLPTATAQASPDGPATSPASDVTRTPTPTPTPVASVSSYRSTTVAAILRYVIPATDYFGMIFAIVLSVVLLLLVMIMLVGRLIGVAHLTGAFLWSVFLIVFLFPWQALLITHENYPTYAAKGDEVTSAEVGPQPAFKVPGVLYTWRELEADYDFPRSPWQHSALKWGRFVAFPLLALLILMMVQTKSSRGLRFALGEADVHVDVTKNPDDML
jgi:hypothetical protein